MECVKCISRASVSDLCDLIKPSFCKARTALLMVDREYFAKYGCCVIEVMVTFPFEVINENTALSTYDR